MNIRFIAFFMLDDRPKDMCFSNNNLFEYVKYYCD